MIDSELTSALIFSIPLVGALVCFGVTALDTLRITHPVRRKIHEQAMTAYGLFAVCWFLLVSREVFPQFHVRAMPVLVPAIMMAYVMLYRMIRTATDPGEGTDLPRYQFALPIIMFSVLTVLWLSLPTEHIARLVLSPTGRPISYIITGICLAYSIGYPVASLIRISRFRRPNQSQTLHDRVLIRLWWAILAEMLVAPVPIFGMLLGLEPFTEWEWIWIVAVLPSRIIYVISCFDLLYDNYLVLDDELPEAPPLSAVSSPQRLSRERIDHYFETKKPWLNPAFRIGDMAEDLFSNRAYVSTFINSEYGMNFSRFVNGYRLDEVERLRAEAKRKKQRVPTLQLILNAGFSSYRSYLRAKDARNDLNYRNDRNDDSGSDYVEYASGDGQDT